MKQELLLKVAFACMACDGKIENSEVDCIQSIFTDIINDDKNNISKLLNEYVKELNDNSVHFFEPFFRELEGTYLSEDDELQLLDIAIRVIEADNIIEYNEIKLLKKIRKYLKVTDEVILSKMPDKEDFIAPDIKEDDLLELYLGSLEFNNIEIKIGQ